MDLPWENGFLEEAEKVNLRFTCEDCVFFIPERGECLHRFPVYLHVRAYFHDDPEQIEFCKEFELV